MHKEVSYAILGASLAGAAPAMSGGIDLSGQSMAPLFEPGTYAELSFGHLAPSVSGIGTATGPTPGGPSGDMAGDFSYAGFVYKQRLGDRMDAALIVDTPFSADVVYPAGQPYYAQGAYASFDSAAVTGLLRYRLDERASVFAGLRYQGISAGAAVPYVADYVVDGGSDTGLGYVLGVAYERPEIGLRALLSYNSAISHSLDSRESSAVLGAGRASSTSVTTPQSLTLELQTGISPNTLLFGGVRWVDWSAFRIAPADFVTLAGEPLVYYTDDIVTYSLGVGHRFSDRWSGAASLAYEAQLGGFASNLGPTDGLIRATLGATWQRDKLSVTGGVSYTWFGNATTALGTPAPAARFTGNDLIGVGLKLGYRF